jgi:hypothetical protein
VASAEDPYQMLLSLRIWLQAQTNKKMTKLQQRQPYNEYIGIKCGGDLKLLKMYC